MNFNRPTAALRPTRSARPTRGGPPPELDLSEMHGYQRTGVRWLETKQRAILADAMGLGKTAQALRWLRPRPRAIVVAPASVLGVWEQQAARWRPDLRVDVYGGELRVPDEGELVGISWDSLPDPYLAIPPSKARRMILEPTDEVDVIFDELHFGKNPEAMRSVLGGLLAAQCRRAIGLTGTPMEGGPEDLWGVLLLLGLTETVFPGGWDELFKLCGGKQRYVRDKKKRPRAIGYSWGDVSPEVKERLTAVMLRRTPADPEVQIDLPETLRFDVPVRAPKDLKKHLDGVVKDAWHGIGPGDLPPFELVAEARKALAKSRIPAALEWVESACLEHPLLVFSAHRAPVFAVGAMKLPKGYKAETLTGDVTDPEERTRIVERFQSGETRVLAMTIKAGGAGLNLTEAGAELFVDLAYTPSANLQAEARAARQGQERRRVLVYRMVSKHPLDERIHEILCEKSRVIEATIGA